MSTGHEASSGERKPTPEIIPTPIEGLIEVKLVVNPDHRGHFVEFYKEDIMEMAGLPPMEVKQANASYSAKRGTLRGIHAEAWDKYVYASMGQVFAGIADMRPDSPTFGQYHGVVLDGTNALYVPRGLGNSQLTLTDNVMYNYVTNGKWDKSVEHLYRRVNPLDPDLNVQWPIDPSEWTISEQDSHLPNMRDLYPENY